MKRMLALAAATMAATLVLAACAKSESTSTSESTTTTTTSSADNSGAMSSATDNTAASAAPSGGEQMAAAGGGAGASVYSTSCSSCHQADGKGSPGAFPPLAGNPVVTGDATKVIHIVKYGLSGAITVNGHAFNGMMPPWGTQLSNKQIADVVTYVRSSWGNKASAVTEAQVAAVAK